MPSIREKKARPNGLPDNRRRSQLWLVERESHLMIEGRVQNVENVVSIYAVRIKRLPLTTKAAASSHDVNLIITTANNDSCIHMVDRRLNKMTDNIGFLIDPECQRLFNPLAIRLKEIQNKPIP